MSFCLCHRMVFCERRVAQQPPRAARLPVRVFTLRCLGIQKSYTRSERPHARHCHHGVAAVARTPPLAAHLHGPVVVLEGQKFSDRSTQAAADQLARPAWNTHPNHPAGRAGGAAPVGEVVAWVPRANGEPLLLSRETPPVEPPSEAVVGAASIARSRGGLATGATGRDERETAGMCG
jgi:hypothetical protein